MRSFLMNRSSSTTLTRKAPLQTHIKQVQDGSQKDGKCGSYRAQGSSCEPTIAPYRHVDPDAGPEQISSSTERLFLRCVSPCDPDGGTSIFSGSGRRSGAEFARRRVISPRSRRHRRSSGSL